jgi:hypothetical protein
VSWSEVFLAVIAVATLIMALIQVGAIVAAARIARDAQRTLATVQRDIRPLVEKANAIADEASRTAAIATAQAEKVDKLITDLSARVDYTSAIVQEAIITPAREGMAVVAAVKAVLGALRGFRDLRPRHGRTADEEDPLFIG